MINREFKNMKIDKYATLTLMAIDPRNPSKWLQELYPSTVVDAVWMDKFLEQTFIEVFNEVEASKEELAKLRVKTLEDSIIVLDKNGYVPLEYMDKKYLMLYNEFKNCKDMLNNCTYDPVEDHGRLVMVNNNTDDPKGTINNDVPHWAIFRLCGNNTHDRNSWEKVWQGIHNEIDYSFDRIPDGVKSTAQMIDNMVRAAHSHDSINRDAFDKFAIDKNGALTWNGKKITMRGSFNSHLVIKYIEQLLAGDIGILVTSSEPYGHYNNTYVHICPKDATSMFEGYDKSYPPKVNTSATENFSKFFKNAVKLKNIPWMNTSVALVFDDFCNGCDNLETVSTLDLHNVITAERAFSDCPNLKYIPPLDLYDATDIIEILKGCESLENIGDITGNHIVQAFSAFEDCKSLKSIGAFNFSQVENWTRIFKNCESLEVLTGLDTEAMTVAFETFAGCKSLKRIETLNMQNCGVTTDMFKGCSSLEYVGIEYLMESISFEGTNLSIECGEEILSNLISVRKNKTISFKNSPASKVSGILIAQAEEKGWTIYR